MTHETPPDDVKKYQRPKTATEQSGFVLVEKAVTRELKPLTQLLFPQKLDKFGGTTPKVVLFIRFV